MEIGGYYYIVNDKQGRLTGKRVICRNKIENLDLSTESLNQQNTCLAEKKPYKYHDETVWEIHYVDIQDLEYNQIPRPKSGEYYNVCGKINGITRNDLAYCLENIGHVHCLLVFPGHSAIKVDVDDIIYIKNDNPPSDLVKIIWSSLNLEIGSKYVVRYNNHSYKIGTCVRYIMQGSDMYEFVDDNNNSFVVRTSITPVVKYYSASETTDLKEKYTKMIVETYKDLEMNHLTETPSGNYLVRLGLSNVVIRLNDTNLQGLMTEPGLRRLPFEPVRTSSVISAENYNTSMPMFIYKLRGSVIKLNMGGILFDLTDIDETKKDHVLYMADKRTYHDKITRNKVLEFISNETFDIIQDAESRGAGDTDGDFQACIVQPEDNDQINISSLFM